MYKMFGATITALLIAAAIPASAATMVSANGTPLSETIKTNAGGNGTSIDFFSDPSNLKVVYSSTSTLSPSSTGGFAFVQGVAGAGFTNLTLTPDNFTFSDIKFNMQLPASTGGFEAPNGYKTDFTFDTTVYFSGGGSQLFSNDVGAGNGQNRFIVTGSIGEAISKIVFSNLVGVSTKNNSPTFTNAFNFDSLRQVSFDAVSGVPEPSTWALFILGFGAIGMMLRSGRGRALSRARA
ncbi:MAG: PEPxxWA-CTERM sorting domain-containing protein [Pseudomonadota bacterium]